MNSKVDNMGISELSKACGIPVSTIKFYQRKGLLPESVKTGKTKAIYSKRHLKRLKLIKKLQNEENVSLEKISKIVSLIDEDTETDPNIQNPLISHRPQIMESAIAIFREKGYENTTIADIVGSVKIGKGTFYKYFSNKKELFIACIKEIIIEEATHVAVYDDVEVKDKNDIIKVLYEHSENLYVISPILRDMINMLRAAAVYNPEEFSGILQEVSQIKIDAFKKQIKTGIKKGILRDIDQTILAVMVTGIHEYCYDYYHTRNLDQAEGIKMLKVIIDIILNGISKE